MWFSGMFLFGSIRLPLVKGAVHGHACQGAEELSEAKVGVMVSQIQPHFMYNALTSIAMMCKIDPDTAQEATVTFAK